MVTIVKNFRTGAVHLATRTFRGKGMQGGGNLWTRCGCAAWMFPKYGRQRVLPTEAEDIITCKKCRRIMSWPTEKSNAQKAADYIRKAMGKIYNYSAHADYAKKDLEKALELLGEK